MYLNQMLSVYSRKYVLLLRYYCAIVCFNCFISVRLVLNFIDGQCFYVYCVNASILCVYSNASVITVHGILLVMYYRLQSVYRKLG